MGQFDSLTVSVAILVLSGFAAFIVGALAVQALATLV